MAKSNLTDEWKALRLACKWLEQSGACTHYPGYICDKDFSTDGVCAKCLERYFLKLARALEAGTGV